MLWSLAHQHATSTATFTDRSGLETTSAAKCSGASGVQDFDADKAAVDIEMIIRLRRQCHPGTSTHSGLPAVEGGYCALVAGKVHHVVMTSSPRPPDVGDRPDAIGGTTARGRQAADARGYLLNNARAEAGERFVWLAELFDGVTRGHFDRLGVRAGSRCWEVGAGGPSIPEALASAVGPSGHVLATDIDPSWLRAGDGYEVRRHDVAADPPPEPGTFDLVHARLVLVHLPDRARVLATMAAALRPGGWLLVEDADTALQPLACLDDSGPAQRRANRLRDAVRELLTRRGADLRYGRTLPRALRQAGLVEVAAAGSFPVGGPACDRLEAATIRHVRGELLAAGLADDAEIDAHLAAVQAGELDLTLAPLISAWGRRPVERSGVVEGAGLRS
jgi:SAM-dependent methyltransferase